MKALPLREMVSLRTPSSVCLAERSWSCSLSRPSLSSWRAASGMCSGAPPISASSESGSGSRLKMARRYMGTGASLAARTMGWGRSETVRAVMAGPMVAPRSARA
ncbi:MAG: hypothetical protein QM765_47600 [Myxococcales bacterium]